MNRLFLIVFFIVSVKSLAQQIPFYNHYVINPFVYNPAVAGFSGDVNAYFVRNQRYTQFNGGTVNNYLTVEGAFMQQKAGIGLTVSHQRQGMQQQSGAGLTYAYKIRLGETQDLRVGVTAGILDNRLDLSAINVVQTNDPYFMGLRPNTTSFDMNVGLLYRWNSLRIGIGVPQVVGNKVTYDKEHSRGYYQLARHIMASAEYDFHLLQSKTLILKPQALVRYVPGGAPVQYDVTAHLEHLKFGWASVTYKSDYALQFNLGMHIRQQLHIGFSYEYLTGSMKNYVTGVNHEVLIGYTFKNRPVETVKIVEVRDTVKVNDTSVTEELLRKNKELEELLKTSLAEKERLQQENATREKEVELARNIQPNVMTADLEVAKGYHFVELTGVDSPDGIYVISGVFSSLANAENTKAKNLEQYPNTYLVVNQKNGYYYVVILYTMDVTLAKEEFRKYTNRTKKKAWILNYRNDKPVIPNGN